MATTVTDELIALARANLTPHKFRMSVWERGERSLSTGAVANYPEVVVKMMLARSCVSRAARLRAVYSSP